MDAFQILTADHEKVSKLFQQVENSSDSKQKMRIFEQIKQELEQHTQIEEKILYPSCAKYDELEDLVGEALEEHRQVKTLLREIDRLVNDSDKLSAKLTVLQEDVEHHVEEEEDELFPKARKLLSKQEMDEMTRLILAEKGQTVAAARQS